MRIRFERLKTLQTVAFTALLAFAPVMAAQAQSGDANARLQRLENEMQTLNRAMFKGEAPPPSVGGAMDATMQSRLDQMESDLRDLTGRVEQQSYDLNRMRDLENRITALESRGSVPTTTGAIQPYTGLGMNNRVVMPAQAVPGYPGQPNVQIPEDSGYGMQDPNALASAASAASAGQLGQMGAGGATDPVTASYEAAYTLLRNQDFAAAEVGFAQFIKENPSSALIPNAVYWLGETYYVRNDFEKAARVFAEAYQKYPKGAKAPDNLLKLAMSLAGMGKTQDACVALGQLKKEYPAGAVPVLSRADQEIARLGCKA